MKKRFILIITISCSLLMFIITILFITGCSYVNKEAFQNLSNRKGPISVTVYPVNIVSGNATRHDPELCGRVVNYLKKENLAFPTAGNVDFSYPFQWGMNQAAMNKRSVTAFANQVKKDSIQTDYAMLVEILTGKDETPVVGVSFYLVDKLGRIAYGRLSNSDWQEFKKINPTNPNGGIELIEAMLKQDLSNDKVILDKPAE